MPSITFLAISTGEKKDYASGGDTVHEFNTPMASY